MMFSIAGESVDSELKNIRFIDLVNKNKGIQQQNSSIKLADV